MYHDFIRCQKPYHLRLEREASQRAMARLHPKHPGKLTPRHQKALAYLRAACRAVTRAELGEHLACSGESAGRLCRKLVALGLATLVKGPGGGTMAKEV